MDGSTGAQGADWGRAERSPELQALVKERRRFVVPGTIFFLTWYLGFVALCGWAPDFMGESIHRGFTVGYALALSQFLMTAVLGVMYLRRADNVWEPLREKAAAVARKEAGE